jgi:transposase InsO family protein
MRVDRPLLAAHHGPAWPLQRFDTGRDRIVRLRRELGLRCKQKRRFEATTNSKYVYPIALNLLEQTFAPMAKPSRGERHHVCRHRPRLALAAGIEDVFTCERVGYALGARMTPDLTALALDPIALHCYQNADSSTQGMATHQA